MGPNEESRADGTSADSPRTLFVWALMYEQDPDYDDGNGPETRGLFTTEALAEAELEALGVDELDRRWWIEQVEVTGEYDAGLVQQRDANACQAASALLQGRLEEARQYAAKYLAVVEKLWAEIKREEDGDGS